MMPSPSRRPPGTVQHRTDRTAGRPCFWWASMSMWVGWRVEWVTMMRRRAWKILCLISLLLAGVVGVLWARSYCVHGRVGYSTKEARYTVHSDRGWLRFTAPPRWGASIYPNVDASVSQALESDIRWTIYHEAKTGKTEGWPNYVCQDLTVAAVRPHYHILLRALEDQHRFLAAHLILGTNLDQSGLIPMERRPDGSIVASWRGAMISFPPRRASEWWNSPPQAQSRVEQYEYGPEDHWTCDVAQLPTIRDYWHDRLDIQIASLPYWPLAVLTLILPAMWARSQLRRVTRRRKGLCLACGYDLRASRDICPECGQLVAQAQNQLPMNVDEGG
jgi:hypothetical protein